MVASPKRLSWVVLVHRLPREPSTPRIAVWRTLRTLGAAQLGDGVAALPEDARTREHLEWVADQVVEAGGTALLLRAQTLARRDEERMARGMAHARAEEYRQLSLKATVAASADEVSSPAGSRTLTRLRQKLRSIQRRDYFPPPERDTAVAALASLAARIAEDPGANSPMPAAKADEVSGVTS
jgi:hypothetical protein